MNVSKMIVLQAVLAVAAAVLGAAQRFGRAFSAKVSARELAVATAVAGSFVGTAANAAGGFTIDPTDVTTTIANGVTVISAIGMAVLSLVVVIKLFKWIQRTL